MFDIFKPGKPFHENSRHDDLLTRTERGIAARQNAAKEPVRRTGLGKLVPVFMRRKP